MAECLHRPTTISGRLATDGVCQSGSQLVYIRLIYVIIQVRINGFTNYVTTVNNGSFISFVKSMANSLSLSRTVPRCTERVKQSTFLPATSPHISTIVVVALCNRADHHIYCTASSSGRQLNCVALNRGHHLCSAGQPSRCALAHIPVNL